MSNVAPGSIETRYGWVVVIASLAVHSIGLGAPTILFVALKPIAADLETSCSMRLSSAAHCG